MGLNYLDELAAKIRAQVANSDLPEADTRDLFRIYAVLLLAKGADVTAADVHNAWAAWMSDADPGHDAIVPFGELPSEVAVDDQPYVEAIRAVARAVA
jgi:hypothetical protein